MTAGLWRIASVARMDLTICKSVRIWHGPHGRSGRSVLPFRLGVLATTSPLRIGCVFCGIWPLFAGPRACRPIMNSGWPTSTAFNHKTFDCHSGFRHLQSEKAANPAFSYYKFTVLCCDVNRKIKIMEGGVDNIRSLNLGRSLDKSCHRPQHLRVRIDVVSF
jgi:hypothetical protein